MESFLKPFDSILKMVTGNDIVCYIHTLTAHIPDNIFSAGAHLPEYRSRAVRFILSKKHVAFPFLAAE